MAKVKSVTLLSVTLPNKVGQLAAVTELLAAADVNMSAIHAAEAGSNGVAVIAVKNAAKAKKALAPLGAEIKESEALCLEMPNKAGRLDKLLRKVAAAGVNIHSAWGTAFTGKTTSCILVTSDDKKAAAALGKK